MSTIATAILGLCLTSACSTPVPSSGGAAAQPPGAQTPEPFDHSYAEFSALLAAHVHGDRVDYRALQASPERLRSTLQRLRAVTPERLAGWSAAQRMAFWINVYNAHTLQLVADAWPIDSIRDLGTVLDKVWNRRFIELSAFDPEGKGRNLSLDDVEHEILRKRFRDPRIHAAVNCASESCPPLRNEAYVAEDLERQLDE